MSPKTEKTRLDVLLVERGLAPSRERAQAMLLAGNVRVNGKPMDKPGTRLAADALIELAGESLRYSSRGGLKLEGALEDFDVTPQEKTCLDVGSSTGGFTDCLLQQGARRVYAVDVTINQLDWKLQKDPRVVTIERNARYLKPDDVGELVRPGDDGRIIYFCDESASRNRADHKTRRRFPGSHQAAIRARKAAGWQGRNCA